MKSENKLLLLSNFFSNWFYTYIEAAACSLILDGKMCSYTFPEWMLMYAIGYVIAINRKLSAFSHGICVKLSKKEDVSNIADVSVYAFFFEILYNLAVCITFDYVINKLSFDAGVFIKSYVFNVLICVPCNILISLFLAPGCDSLAEKLIKK